MFHVPGFIDASFVGITINNCLETVIIPLYTDVKGIALSSSHTFVGVKCKLGCRSVVTSC